VGSSLVDQKAVAAGDMKKIESLARQFVEVVGKFKSDSS
jgi:2-keto-3-deoxy-6-phosphogluconate aldolase